MGAGRKTAGGCVGTYEVSGPKIRIARPFRIV